MLFNPYSACCISRYLASVDWLALQESYFDRLHNLAPYFVLLAFDQLKSVYVSPLQWKYNIDWLFCCKKSFSFVLCFQEFIFCIAIVPFIFWTALDTSDPPLSYPALHHLLEEFSSVLLQQSLSVTSNLSQSCLSIPQQCSQVFSLV